MSDATGNDAISYEAARDELLEVVRQLEAGGLTLEKSLTLWERGEQLAVICQSWLDGAKDRLAARRPPGTEGAASAAAADSGGSDGSD
ncbi:MAG: exodeoxyribonuclease small subunit [Actinomycetota bacterium]|jgi:exodeoxyribonuclease VII small subunit|nr:exodeoxyribonuclease small subunit [Actinomycetota bacterium]